MLSLPERIAEREREHKEGPNKVVIVKEDNKEGQFKEDAQDELVEAHFDRYPGQSKLQSKQAFTVEGDDSTAHAAEAQAARDATQAADMKKQAEMLAASGAGGNGSGASPFPPAVS